MFNAKMSGDEVKAIGNMVGDILSQTTNCFDYCAQDIFDFLIEPQKPGGYKTKPRVYFPFYLTQFDERFWKEAYQINPTACDYLKDLAQKAEQRDIISNTSLGYFVPRQIRSLVNTNKHDKVIEVTNKGEPEIVSELAGGMKVVVPLGQLGHSKPPGIITHGDVKTTVAKAYELEATHEEVGMLCLYAIQSTRHILNTLYRELFNTEAKLL